MSDVNWNDDELLAYLNSPEVQIGSNLYATDIHDWEWLQEAVPSLIVSSAGGFVPFQAEGYIHGFSFYMRAEDGSASLAVSPVIGEPPYSTNPRNLYAHIRYGEGRHEVQRPEMFIPHLMVLLERLEKPPFRYEFPYVKPVYDEATSAYVPADGDGETGVYFGWGETPEEAYEHAERSWKEPNDYWNGGADYWDMSVPDRTPVNVDDRDFSVFDGVDFSVKWERLPATVRALAEEAVLNEPNRS